ncbi:hypothetical protein NE237_030454 [Protea cynaroides]|uniref:Amino acid transporter transmembrane domain-containing protein n=1 Tax=Protea cynaroides TaxID=273540 RepID=A0A9Q0GXA0_9MAGN|nr:hypothetical protein NE237_030454 [Protea cynaroides]
MVGAGVLGLPFALSELGWYPGIGVIVMSWLVTLYSLWQLVELHECVPGKRFDRYPELGQHAFGLKRGYWIVMPQQLIVQVATDIVYMVTGGNSLKKFFELVVPNLGSMRKTYYILFFGGLQVVLSQIPNFNSLKGVSLLAAVMSVSYSAIAFIASTIRGAQHNQAVSYGIRATTTPGTIFDIFNGMGTIAFSFAGHSVVLEIQATIPSSPEKPSSKPMWKGVVVAYLIVAFCYLSVAIAGYWAFGVGVDDDVLVTLNNPNWLIAAANLMVFFHVLGSYQVFAMPVFDMIESYLVQNLNFNPGYPIRLIGRSLYVRKSALLQLKQKHYYLSDTLPDYFDNDDPLNSWKPDSDCCFWDGITCDGNNGHVVGLDLSDLSLTGSIHSNSCLFHLHHLQMLNLSMNDFDYFAPSGFHILSRGQVPSEFSKLTKLVSLDLSRNYKSRLEIPNLGVFVQNLSSMRKLRLDGVNLSTQQNRYWCRNLSFALPNLQVLSMRGCSLTSPLDSSISNLHFLSELYLDFNSNLSSTVPTSLMNLTSLTVLSLSYCGFHGDFPANVFLQPNLKCIDLGENSLLSGHLPEFPQANTPLQYLSVGGTKFQGKLPSSVENLKFLEGLFLWGCNFSGAIPLSLANLTHLTELDLSSNSFIGQISSLSMERVPKLERLYLGSNLVEGLIPSSLFSMIELNLTCNKFSKVIFEHNSSYNRICKSPCEVEVRAIDLSYNRIAKFPNRKFPGDFMSLSYLDLSHNRITGFPNRNFLGELTLSTLDISSNRISGAIPKWIWQNSLISLNLSNNLFTGLELPLTNHSNIAELDLHSNMIQECLSSAPCFPQTFNQSKSEFVSDILGNLTSLLSVAYFFSISDNKLTGKIPFSICNARNLEILDLSNNQLSGTIPTCLDSSNLGVLNLESNKLHGPIPPIFKKRCNIHTLKLNKNMLQGEVPRSLGNCKGLTVLDIADNQLNGTFPYWLENLSELQVVVMRSNKFGGPIAQLPQADSPFPSLHVIDLSFNNFTGSLPLQYICHWKAMMFDKNNSELQFHTIDANHYYQDTIVVIEKGQYLKMQRILTIFATVDLSNNNFTGKIPDALGILKALKVLNLSGNCLTGQIPFSFGNLSELESLDLSRNKLSGEIPRQLTSLTFLEVLDVSYNNFRGSIPHGNQFNTFSNTSYEGNAGLCGLPLSRKCGITDRTLPSTLAFEQKDDSTCLLDWKFADDSTCLLDWKFIVAGCCSGLVVGLVIGQQLFWRKNKCSKFISRVVVSKQRKKSTKTKHHNRRK